MRKHRRSAAAVVALLIAVLSGVFIVAPPAHALLDVCTTDGANAAPLPELSEWAPPLASNKGAAFVGSSTYGATAYEWFGGGVIPFLSAGSFDSSAANPLLNADCADFLNGSYAKGMGGIYNMAWTLGSYLNQVALWVYQSAQSTEFLTLLVDRVVDPVFNESTQGAGFADWYRQALIIVMILTAMWAGVRVLQGRAKQAATGVAWHLVFAVLGLFLIASPGILSSTVQTAFRTLSSALGESADNIASTVVGVNDAAVWCDLDDESINYELSETRQAEDVRESTCRMWVATYLEPWARGQFGTADPIATDSINAEGVVDGTRWIAAEKNKDLAVIIPGLENQPTPGSLVALQLAATRLNPREQAWVNAQVSENKIPEWVLLSQLRGGEDIEDNYNFGKAGYTYPNTMKEKNPCPAEGECLANDGHQQMWQVLVDRATGSADPAVASTWQGVSPMASDARVNAVVLMTSGTLILGGVSGFFSIIMLWYQLLLAVMMLFMGFALLGMAIPGIGTQIARDFFARIIEYVIMLTTVTLFLPVTVVLMMYIPDLILPDTIGVFTSGMAIAKFLISLVVGAVMIFAFFRTRKTLRGRQYIKGARAKSPWDVGSRIADGVGKAGVAAVAVGGVAAAAAASGGLAAGLAATKGKAAIGGGSKPAADQGEAPAEGSGDAGSTKLDLSPLTVKPAGVSSTGPKQDLPSVAAGSWSGASAMPLAAASASPASAAPSSSGRQAGEEAAKGFWSSFGTAWTSQMGNFSKKAISSLMNGGGLDQLIHTSRATLTEMATGTQVKTLVTDARGRQTILESGIDSSERMMPQYGSSPMGGVDSRLMFEAVYAGVLAADAQRAPAATTPVAPMDAQGVRPEPRPGVLLCGRCSQPMEICTCSRF